ncbi:MULTISPECIES: phage tail tape measure protein [Corynebacterium]|uniref:phage tail tape measure protein n=1 Tax=Corynebacterium TaxID=1716 RepID=UPI001CEFA4F2|nr:MULTISPECIES: phage tail tape measure protein [Corynebacterium]
MWVPVLASMKGFVAEVNRGAERAAGQAGSTLKKGLSESTKAGGADGAAQMAKAVEAQTQKIANARRAEVRASAEVQAAEQKLKALRESSTATASQIARAEGQLETAKARQSTASQQVARGERDLESVRKGGQATARSVARAEDALSQAKEKSVTKQGQLRAAEARLDEARAKSEAASARVEAAEKSLIRVRDEYGEESREAARAERELESAKRQASSADVQLASASGTVTKARAEVANATDNVRSKTLAHKAAQEDASRAERKAGDNAQGAGAKVRFLGREMRLASGPATNLTGSLMGMSNRAMGFAGIAAAGLGLSGVTSFMSSAVTSGREFDKVLGSLSAVSGATADQMSQIRDRARELGQDTDLAGTSAASAADAMLALAKGGLDVQQSMDAAKGSIQLAGAAQIDAGQAAEIQIAALNSFGLAAGEAGRVADVLTNTANNSATGVTELSEALKMAAPTASTLGVSLEDTNTMIGLFANNGIKGTMAGTAMRSAMLSLTSPSKQAANALDELGIEAFDAEGNFVGLRDVSEQLKEAHERMGDSAFTAASSVAFGREAVGFATTAAKGGAEAFDELRGKMDKAGSAGETAGAALAGMNGALDRVGNSLADVKQRLYDAFAPTLTTLIDAAAKAFKFVADGIGFVTEGIGKFKPLASVSKGLMIGLAAAATALVAVNLGHWLWGATAGLREFNSAMIRGAWGKFIGWIKAATGAVRAFNFTMLANPIVLVVAAIAAVIAALALFFTKTETGRKLWAQFTDFMKSAWDATVQAFKAGYEAYIKPVWDWIVEGAKAAWDGLKGVFDWIGGAFGGLKSLLVDGDFTGAFREAFNVEEDSKLVDFLLTARENFIRLKDVVGDVAGWIGEKLRSIPFAEIGGGLVDALKWLGNAASAVWEHGIRPLAEGLANGVRDAVRVAGDAWGWWSSAVSDKYHQNIEPPLISAKETFDKLRDGVKIALELARGYWDDWTGALREQYQANIAPTVDRIREKWDVLRTAIGKMVDDFKQKWNVFRQAIAPAVDVMKQKLGELRDTVGDFFKRMWEPVIKPALKFLAFVVLAPLIAGLVAVVAAIAAVVGVVGGFIYVLVSLPGWVKSAVDAVTGFFTDLWNNTKKWFLEMGLAIHDWWQEHVATLPDRVSEAVAGVKQWFSDMWSSVKDWFADMGRVVADWWNNHIKPLPSQIAGAVRGVLENLGQLPGRIRSLFADAGQWLVSAGQRIINGLWEGMKRAWNNVKNWLSDHLSFSAIGSLVGLSSGGVVESYARGGVAEAYAGGGRREDHRAQIAPAGAWRVWAEPETGGEAYIPLAASKRARSAAILDEVAGRFGYQLVGRDGAPYDGGYRGDLGPQRVAAFANGAVVGADDLVRFAQGQGASRPLEGAPYVWGGSNWGDCSGAMSAFAAFAVGLNPFPRKFSTANEGSWLSSHGFMRGRGGDGDLRIGYKNGGPAGGHTAGTLPNGVNVEMGGGRGNGQYGGGAAGAWDSYFNEFYYLPMGPSFGRVELGGLGDLPGVPDTPYDAAAASSSYTGSSTTSTGSTAGGGAESTSISGMLGDLSKEVVSGHVADVLGVFGVPDELPSWVTGARKLARGEGRASTSAAEDHAAQIHDDAVTSMTPAELQADPQLRGADSMDTVSTPDVPEWGQGFFVREIARAARELGLGAEGARIGVATALVESGEPLRMLANNAVPESLKYRHDGLGGDHDSVGLFQQRDNGAWGTVADRMDAFKSASMFFRELAKLDWRGMDPGAAAQKVQRSAFPGRYAGKIDKAEQLVQGAGLFDQGGVLKHGQLGLNLSRKPEAVLTNDQWRDLQGLAAALPSLAGGAVSSAVGAAGAAGVQGLNAAMPGAGAAISPFIGVTSDYAGSVAAGWTSAITTAAGQAVGAVGEAVSDVAAPFAEPVSAVSSAVGGEFDTAEQRAASAGQRQEIHIHVQNMEQAYEAKKRLEARALAGFG